MAQQKENLQPCETSFIASQLEEEELNIEDPILRHYVGERIPVAVYDEPLQHQNNSHLNHVAKLIQLHFQKELKHKQRLLTQI